MPPEQANPTSDMNESARTGAHGVDSSLTGFTTEELAALSRVLISILHAGGFDDLLMQIHQSLNCVCDVDGCAVYRVSDHGLGLQIVSGVGDYKSYLPDAIPQASRLFRSLASRSFADLNVSRCLQPSLFDDHPASLFGPVVVEDRLVGVLAVLHRARDTHFVTAVTNEAITALGLLCKVYFISDGLSLHTNSGDEARVKKKPAIEPEPDNSYSKLTPREKEVLSLLAEGLSNKEVAGRLYISSATCKHHVENILAKLQTPNRAAAVAIALAHPHNLGSQAYTLRP